MAVMPAVFTRLPLVPVTVIANDPVGVPGPALIISVDVPAPVTEAGEKLAAAPAGSPVALNVTAPLKPF